MNATNGERKKAYDAIRNVQNETPHKDDEMLETVRTLCDAVMHIDHVEDWPPINASPSDVGHFNNRVRKQFANYFDGAGIGHTVTTTPPEPSLQSLKSLVRADNKILPIMQSMVQKFVEAEGSFAERRVISATWQMQSDGKNDNEIAALVGDTTKLRKYIAKQRKELVMKLDEVSYNVQHEDPMNIPTHADVQLLLKHLTMGWYPSDENDDNYLPNDTAVDYLVMTIEVLWKIKRHGATSAELIYETFLYVAKVFLKMTTDQAISKGWAQMRTMFDYSENGVAIGDLFRDLSSDPTRVMPLDAKSEDLQHQGAHLRAPMRYMRIFCATGCHTCAYNVIYCEEDQLATRLVDLNRREIRATAALDAASRSGGARKDGSSAATMKVGAEGFSVAESVLWLSILERRNLFAPYYGRNDLSVPKLCTTITGIAFGLDDLPPRSWSVGEVDWDNLPAAGSEAAKAAGAAQAEQMVAQVQAFLATHFPQEVAVQVVP